MQKICVVEDEKSIAEMIRLNLEIDGYDVVHFDNGLEASKSFDEKIDFDLIILDVMLPGMNGIEICKNIRKKSKTPILFLSARGTTGDRIEGLKAGGNDYLPKPFDLEELLLRVGALLPVIEDNKNEIIIIGDCEVNFKTYIVTDNKTSETVQLSKKEVKLLQLFIQKPDEVISRSEILDKVWGKNQFPTTRTIDNYILHFRKIFELNPKEPNYFHSIRGVGYKYTN